MDSLPNELILQILEELEYTDLKYNIPLVSRRFNELIKLRTKTGAIDKKLFRDIPVANTIPTSRGILEENGRILQMVMASQETPPTLHPIFEMLSWKYVQPAQEIMVVDGNRMINLMTSDIRKENATSPAVDCLNLCLTDFTSWVFFIMVSKKINNQAGASTNDTAEGEWPDGIRSPVTIRDVISGMNSIMQSSIDNDQMAWLLSNQGRDITAVTGTDNSNEYPEPLITLATDEKRYNWGHCMIQKEFGGFQYVKSLDGVVFLVLDQRRLVETWFN